MIFKHCDAMYILKYVDKSGGSTNKEQRGWIAVYLSSPSWLYIEKSTNVTVTGRRLASTNNHVFSCCSRSVLCETSWILMDWNPIVWIDVEPLKKPEAKLRCFWILGWFDFLSRSWCLDQKGNLKSWPQHSYFRWFVNALFKKFALFWTIFYALCIYTGWSTVFENGLEKVPLCELKDETFLVNF